MPFFAANGSRVSADMENICLVQSDWWLLNYTFFSFIVADNFFRIFVPFKNCYWQTFEYPFEIVVDFQ